MPTSAPGNNPLDRRGGGAARSAEHGFTSRWRYAEHGFTSRWRYAEHGFTSRWRYAEHGFTSRWRYAEHGFTLIELMVVVTIIGLAAAVVVWALPDPRGRVQEEAARFALRVRAAHDLAIVEARPTSVWLTPAGYGFDQRVTGRWAPIGEKPLRVERWTTGTLAATGEGRTRIVFDETGLADRSAQIILSRGKARASIAIDADGTVRTDAI